MAIATFALIDTVSPVDSVPVHTELTVTDPAGLALPVITIPADQTSAVTPPLTVVGTYT